MGVGVVVWREESAELEREDNVYLRVSNRRAGGTIRRASCLGVADDYLDSS